MAGWRLAGQSSRTGLFAANAAASRLLGHSPQESIEGKRLAEVLPDRVLLYTDSGDRTAAEATGRGLSPESVVVRRSTLEDVFLRLTGRTLVD